MSKQKSEFAFIEIPVKPYTAKYLKDRYGEKINFSRTPLQFLDRHLNLLLRTQLTRHDLRIRLKRYTETVKIVISEDQLNRYGSNLSATGIVNWNDCVEELIKHTMVEIVLSELKNTNNLREAIRLALCHLGLTEEVFPLDTAVKYCQRLYASGKEEFMALKTVIYGTSVQFTGTRVQISK